MPPWCLITSMLVSMPKTSLKQWLNACKRRQLVMTANASTRRRNTCLADLFVKPIAVFTKGMDQSPAVKMKIAIFPLKRSLHTQARMSAR